jgi:multiple sugar transport system ATP-binding protein
MAEIKTINLHKRFTDFVAVRESNLTVRNGEFFVLLGPSGCGKTTTLRMIAGLELPTDGQILLDGEDVTYTRARARDIAFVFQLFALYPHMNVRQNMAFPLVNEGFPKAEVKQRVEEIAAMLRIDHLLDKSVSGLAGGDRQRVALGRAIVRKPKAFLMDEPLGTLDSQFRELMCLELRRLHDRLGATTVYVTHDQSEAMTMADTIVVMNKGDVLQADSPDRIYNCPNSIFVGQFIGAPPMNFLTVDSSVAAQASSINIEGVKVSVPRQLIGSSKVVLGIRPEWVSLTHDGGLRGEVQAVEYLGSHQIVTVKTAAGTVRTRVNKDLQVRLLESIGVNFDPGHCILYDTASERLLESEFTAQYTKARVHGDREWVSHG